jgi:hypothetical protein
VIVDPRVARRKFERDVQPILEDPDAFGALGMRLIEASYPVLRVGLTWPKRQLEIPLELRAENWDYRPASATWVNEDGGPWKGPVPNANGLQAGDATRRPWLCFPGTLEYHEYPGHHTDLWWPKRRLDSLRLLGFVQHIAAVLRKTE